MAPQLPPFVPFPPSSISFRTELVPEEWAACLDSWVTLAQAHLRLPAPAFLGSVENEKSGLVSFLQSYFSEASNESNPSTPAESALRKATFLLSHRTLSLESPPSILLKQSFLSNLCKAFPKSHELQRLLSSLWKRKGSVIEQDLQRSKEIMIKELDSGKVSFVEANMKNLAPLLHCSPDVATFFMVGSDLLDSINAAFPKSGSAFERSLTFFTYFGLASLTVGDKPNLSLLSDHLYGLKPSTGSKPGQKSLLAGLASNTPLIDKIKASSPGDAAGKARKIEQFLTEFRTSTTKPKIPIRRKIDKGKERVTEASIHGEMHMHRMSLITQIQDLFPDLGSGFITKLLDEYGENVERVIAHLLEDSLPPHLQSLDRSEKIPSVPTTDPAPHMIPHSTPPQLPTRRNVFDNDEFDQLAIDTSKFHQGRKHAKLTADAVLADRSTAPNKAAILSALAAFDSDDDERDDTYDIEDVGGTVDSTTDESGNVDKNEELLFTTYRTDHAVFGRDGATRRGQARAKLRLETGMTDEGIEGWALMIGRDPRRLRRLEGKYAGFHGNQSNLERTAYRASPQGSGDEQEGVFNAGRGGRGRGRGGGGGGGGGRGRGRGNVAGPSGDADTVAAQKRKEANKGSRANHNRRDQRAKKMARGGFPPAG